MTLFANRKSKVRAYQAAHSGMAYRDAAREIDIATTADLLAGLRHTPMVALAAALNTAGEHVRAAKLARSLARKQASEPEAERLAQAASDAYDAMIAAPAGLSAADNERLSQAYNDADNARYYPSPDDDPYGSELAVVGVVFTALSAAATGAGDARSLTRAAADVLGTLHFEFTADAIRGHRDTFGAVPDAADAPTARQARNAAAALAAAVEIQRGGDEDWQRCIGLLNQAMTLADTAADGAVHRDQHTTGLADPEAARLQTAFDDVLRAQPHLTDSGFGVGQARGQTARQREQEFVQQRARLLASLPTVARVYQWLREHIAPIKTPARSSYGVKHIVENVLGDYVSNGELIAAAIMAGYPMGTPHGLNVAFAMSKRDLDRESARARGE